MVVVFVFNVLPKANVIWRWSHSLKSHHRLVKSGIEPATAVIVCGVVLKCFAIILLRKR